MDFLPYYFKSNDTYKDNNGKGLLEKYLEIFGNYFEDIIVTDIKSLSDILDISNTDDIYLGYLWEFLGQLPYANPKAIDPDKWKAYFNGFDSDTTIHQLSKYWLYPKDTVDGDLILSEDTVRDLLKYSITLFKIRGTEKFFKTLMALYGLKIDILESQSSPITVSQHDDDYDYAGTDQDYLGDDDDYAGVPNFYKKFNTVTKIDGSGASLNNGSTMDNTSVCNTCASIHFKLYIPSSILSGGNVDKYIDRIESIIKRFLPINVRPIFEWVDQDGQLYSITGTRILRPFVLVDTLPRPDYIPSYYNNNQQGVGEIFETMDGYPGWYLYLPNTISNLRILANGGFVVPVHANLSELNWIIGTKVRVMVLILPVDSLGTPIDIKDDIELNPVFFTINDGELEYESGHIFEFIIGSSKIPISINPKPVLLDNYWKAWYTQDLPVIFNASLKRVSYKFGVDYNSEVITSFDYGDKGSIPILSYKEIALIVNGTIVDTKSLPVSFIWNNDKDNPYYPEPLEDDETRYRFTIEPTTSGEQFFYMLDNPARHFTVITNMNKLDTRVVLTPSVLQLDDDNLSVKSRIDVRLGDGSIDIPNVLPGYEVDIAYKDWFNSNVTVNSDRGLCKAYYSGTFTVITDNVNRGSLLSLYIPILANPVHNNSQNMEITCIGHINITEEDGEEVYDSVTLKANINLLTKNINFIQLNDDGTVINGPSSWYGILNNRAHNTIFNIEDVSYSNGYKIVKLTFNIGVLVHGLDNSTYKIDPSLFYWNLETLSYTNLIVRSVKNKDLVYNVGELASFNRPSIQEFKASYINDISFSLVNATSGRLDIIGAFSSGIKYTLEIIDNDYSDNKANTIRLPYRFDERTSPKASIKLDLNLFTNLNQVNGIDTEHQFPNYFDWDVVIFWGSTPMGQLLTTVTCDDDSYNEVPDPYDDTKFIPANNYGKSGSIILNFNKVVEKDPETGDIISVGDRDYEPRGTDNPGGSNFPPGLYTIMMHSRSPMEGQDYYRVIELYEDRDPNERQIHIDVDVISRAWINPIGINGSTNPSKTWGYYKSHLESMVTEASYDTHVEVPEFRVLLSNNNIGYKKVWLYKALPIESFNPDSDMVEGNINYRDLIYQDIGGDSTKTDSSSLTKSPGTGNAWIFTGTVYDIGELVKGPEEPGSYMLVVHQTIADKVTIGKAYIEVVEKANYVLRINPTAAVLEEEDTAVQTEINVTSDAKWPKKLRLWSAATNKWLNLDGDSNTSQTIFPVTFLAYTAGVYDFTVYEYDESTDSWVILQTDNGQLNGTFNVVRNTTLSPEYRTWLWDSEDILTVDLAMVNSDSSIPWTAIISEDQ